MAADLAIHPHVGRIDIAVIILSPIFAVNAVIHTWPTVSTAFLANHQQRVRGLNTVAVLGPRRACFVVVDARGWRKEIQGNYRKIYGGRWSNSNPLKLLTKAMLRETTFLATFNLQRNGVVLQVARKIPSCNTHYVATCPV